MEDYQARRRRQSADTEQAILRAALDLCRACSYDKVTVRDICRRAGITTGAFYHHFASKDALLHQGFASLDAFMEQALAGHEDDPPAQRLVLILQSYAGFMEDLGWELAARYYQQRLGAPDFRSMDSRRYTLRAVRICLEQARGQGLLPAGVAPDWAANFLLRHFRGVVIDWIINRGTYSLPGKLEQDYQFFWQIFQAGQDSAAQNTGKNAAPPQIP